MESETFETLKLLILDGLWGTQISRIFTVAIVALAMLFPILQVLSPKKSRKSIIFDHIPALLTTIGLFGTFVGIAVGLGHFDVNTVDRSLPQLLVGMKLAFWTSILGMACSLFYKIVQAFLIFFRKQEKITGATADDIYQVMLQQNKILSQHETLLGRIEKVSEERNQDKSLIDQVSLLREETIENLNRNRDSVEQHLKELTSAVAEFMENITQNSTDSLISALNEVLRDFNTKINEQFGDNFKELNEAVRALLEWQENYKDHVDTTEMLLQSAVEKILSISESVRGIDDSMQSIPEAAKSLANLLEALEIELEKASELLEGFASMKNNAENVFPAIKNGFEVLALTLSDTIAKTTGKIEAAVTNQEMALNQTTDHLKNWLSKTFSSQDEALEEINKRYTELALKQGDLVKSGVEGLENRFTEVFTHIGDGLKEKFTEFDELMEKEMSNAIARLGRQLASIAEKLVEDNEKIINQFTDLANTLPVLMQSIEKTRRISHGL